MTIWGENFTDLKYYLVIFIALDSGVTEVDYHSKIIDIVILLSILGTSNFCEIENQRDH